MIRQQLWERHCNDLSKSSMVVAGFGKGLLCKEALGKATNKKTALALEKAIVYRACMFHLVQSKPLEKALYRKLVQKPCTDHYMCEN